MARDEIHKDWLGNTYVVHFDDDDLEVGRSLQGTTLTGGAVERRYDSEGNLLTTSHSEQSAFGGERKIARAADGSIDSITTREKSLLSDDVEVKRNAAGEVVSHAYKRKGLLGGEYKEVVEATQHAGGYGCVIGFVLVIAALSALLLLALSLLVTIPIWLGAPAVAAVVAFFHAPAVARNMERLPLPEPTLTARSGKRPPYHRLTAHAIPPKLPLQQSLWVGVLSGIAYAGSMSAFVYWSNSIGGGFDKAITIGAGFFGAYLAYCAARRMYLLRLNELILSPRGIDCGSAATIAKVWNAVGITGVAAVLILLAGTAARGPAQAGSVMARSPQRETRSAQAPIWSHPPATTAPLAIVAPSAGPSTSPRLVAASTQALGRTQPAAPTQFARTSRSIAAGELSLAPNVPAGTAVAAVPLLVTNSPSPPPPGTAAGTSPAAAPREDDVDANEGLDLPLGVGWNIPTLQGEQFPETRTRLLRADELVNWSPEKLRYAINESYARRGAKFGDASILHYFIHYTWYHPRDGADFDVVEQDMTPVERENLKTLGAAREAQRNTSTGRRPAASRAQRQVSRDFPPDPVGQTIGHFFDRLSGEIRKERNKEKSGDRR